MIFWWLDLRQGWDVWMKSSKVIFLVKKAEIVSLKPEHQSETHFLKRRIFFWMNLGGMLSWIKGM